MAFKDFADRLRKQSRRITLKSNKMSEKNNEEVEETLEEQEDNVEAEGSEEEANADEAVQEMKDKYLRLMAEFENYKKRTFREKLETINTASREMVVALLPVLDDFDRAKQVAEDDSTTEQFSEGVELVYNKLKSVMQNKGLKPMETNGQPFDPEYHEALTEIPAAGDDQKGIIIDTIEKGYTLNDTIIRHAKVVVGK